MHTPTDTAHEGSVALVPEIGQWTRAALPGVEHPVWVWRLDDPSAGAEVKLQQMAYERLKNLHHPAIPQVARRSRSRGELALVAPLGVPLSKVLEHRHDEGFGMSPSTVLDVGAQLAAALVHAHDHGRPHGHLHPDAIWLSPQGQLVIWGYAEGPDGLAAERWRAPECARGGRGSGDADQWALCAILASLVTGRLPWRSEDPESEATHGDTTHLWAPVLDQWKPLGRLLQRGLSNDPRERFTGVHPIRHALQALRQRVQQPSGLEGIGVRLLELHGPPAPEPEPEFEEADEMPTYVGPAPELPQLEPDAVPTTVEDMPEVAVATIEPEMEPEPEVDVHVAFAEPEPSMPGSLPRPVAASLDAHEEGRLSYPESPPVSSAGRTAVPFDTAVPLPVAPSTPNSLPLPPSLRTGSPSIHGGVGESPTLGPELGDLHAVASPSISGLEEPAVAVRPDSDEQALHQAEELLTTMGLGERWPITRIAKVLLGVFWSGVFLNWIFG